MGGGCTVDANRGAVSSRDDALKVDEDGFIDFRANKNPLDEDQGEDGIPCVALATTADLRDALRLYYAGARAERDARRTRVNESF